MYAIFILLILFLSISIHEISHGAVALSMGDDTAKREGRLTLNPVAHIDPIGTIFLPLFLLVFTGGNGPIFGWAKPVPINPYLFKDRRWGIVKVSLAGPVSNLLIGAIFSLIIRFFHPQSHLLDLFSIVALYNFVLAIFNLLPFPPLDGFHLIFHLLPQSFDKAKIFLAQWGLWFLFFVLFFGGNLLFFSALFLFRIFSGS